LIGTASLWKTGINQTKSDNRAFDHPKAQAASGRFDNFTSAA
jgi:hypothetical protein